MLDVRCYSNIFKHLTKGQDKSSICYRGSVRRDVRVTNRRFVSHSITIFTLFLATVANPLLLLLLAKKKVKIVIDLKSVLDVWSVTQ